MNKIVIEGWEPTPVERALMEGTFDELITENSVQEVPEDLKHFKEFGQAIENIKRELGVWQSSYQEEQNGA